MGNSNAIVVLALRLGLVAILYLVILQIVAVSRREMALGGKLPSGSTTAGSQPVGYLVVVDSGGTPLVPGQRLEIQPITTIGRSSTNTIVLDSSFVSNEHTRIIFKDRSLWVEDMGSRNGTFVDQQRISAPVAVAPGTIVQVGDVRFKLAPLDTRKGS
jgi:FHA domain-containing protein